MKHLLKLGGLTREEILHVLDVADEYKRLHSPHRYKVDLSEKLYDLKRSLIEKQRNA